MSRFSTDNTDNRRATYGVFDQADLPQHHKVKDRTAPRRAAQPGADIRVNALPRTALVLPEGLVRERKPPLNPRTGRRPTE